MHLFVLDSCKIYAQLVPETKNVRGSEGFKIIRRKVIWEYQPARLSISSSGARSRVRDVYLWKAICALELLFMFKRVSTKCALSSSREERASAFLMPNDWGEGGYETALFLGGYTILRRTAGILASLDRRRCTLHGVTVDSSLGQATCKVCQA